MSSQAYSLVVRLLAESDDPPLSGTVAGTVLTIPITGYTQPVRLLIAPEDTSVYVLFEALVNGVWEQRDNTNSTAEYVLTEAVDTPMATSIRLTRSAGTGQAIYNITGA